MRPSIDPEFKEALLNLPQKEKDKYFLRLLKKDDILFHRLKFELTSGETRDELRNALEERIVNIFKNLNLRDVYAIGKLMRNVSGDITYHVKITTDKFGEPYLNALMIAETLKRFNKKMNAHAYQTEGINQYIIGRLFKILTQVQKLHEDDQFEFQEMFSQIADLIKANKKLLNKSMEAQLNLNWLWDNIIPTDVADIAKAVRKERII